MEQAREKGRRWVISTQEEMRQAVIDVAREAKRKVSIFTHDLEPGIYDDPDFLEVIKRCVLSQTYARIRVLIADPSRAIKIGNSFVYLGRRLNTYAGKVLRTPTNRPSPSSTAGCSTKYGSQARSSPNFGRSGSENDLRPGAPLTDKARVTARKSL
jgi:hypothetical protein